MFYKVKRITNGIRDIQMIWKDVLWNTTKV